MFAIKMFTTNYVNNIRISLDIKLDLVGSINLPVQKRGHKEAKETMKAVKGEPGINKFNGLQCLNESLHLQVYGMLPKCSSDNLLTESYSLPESPLSSS